MARIPVFRSDRLSTGCNDANVVNACLKTIAAEIWAQAEAAGLPKTEVENSVREAQNGALSIVAGHSKGDISRQIRSEPENAEKIPARKTPVPLDHKEKEQLGNSAAALTEVRTDLSEHQGHQEVAVLDDETVRVLKSASDDGDAAGFRALEATAEGTELGSIVASVISVEDSLLPFDAKMLSGMSQTVQEIRDGEVSDENRKAVDRLERSLNQNPTDRYAHVFRRMLRRFFLYPREADILPSRS